MHLVGVDLPPANDGGVASWTDDLGVALAQAGEAVTVWTRRPRVPCAAPERPYTLRRMWGRSWGQHQALWALGQVAGALRAGDRLLCATWPVARWLAPWAARRGVAVGVAFHGSELTRLREAPPGLHAVLRACRARFAVSRYLAGRLAALGGEARVLPMPLAVGSPREGDGRGLVVLARLTPLKGVDRVLALAQALGWPVRIVGDGPEAGALRARAEALGVQATFTGRLPREQALAQVREAAVCALLPRTDGEGLGAEGLGLCLLEAMAQGVPVVGCATGGVPEAVGPGLLLASPDDAQGSAAAVRGFLARPGRGAEGWAWVQRAHGPAQAAAALLEALG